MGAYDALLLGSRAYLRHKANLDVLFLIKFVAMRFGRKTVLDTDPPKKIKGRERTWIIIPLKNAPEKGFALTGRRLSDKGSYKGMYAEGRSYLLQDNMPFDEFLSQDYFFTLEPQK